MVLELGCLLDWLRNGVTGSSTIGLGVPSWVQDYCLLGTGTWGFLQVLIGPGRGDGAWEQWEVTLFYDNPLPQSLLAGAC